MHGQGTIYYVDGRVFRGAWENGRIHGEGTIHYPGGGQFAGVWSAGKLQEAEMVEPAAPPGRSRR
jgi:hypothetical protein